MSCSEEEAATRLQDFTQKYTESLSDVPAAERVDKMEKVCKTEGKECVDSCLSTLNDTQSKEQLEDYIWAALDLTCDMPDCFEDRVKCDNTDKTAKSAAGKLDSFCTQMQELVDAENPDIRSEK